TLYSDIGFGSSTSFVSSGSFLPQNFIYWSAPRNGTLSLLNVTLHTNSTIGIGNASVTLEVYTSSKATGSGTLTFVASGLKVTFSSPITLSATAFNQVDSTHSVNITTGMCVQMRMTATAALISTVPLSSVGSSI